MWIVYLRRTLYSPSACCLLLAPTLYSIPVPHKQLAGILAAGRSIKRRHDVKGGNEKGDGKGGREKSSDSTSCNISDGFLCRKFCTMPRHTHTYATGCTVATHLLLLLLLLLLRVLAKCKLRRRQPVVAIIAPRQFQMKAGVSNVNFCQPTRCGGKWTGAGAGAAGRAA